MTGWIGVLSRLVTGVASLVFAWLVLDHIHDRKAEIAVACIGLTHCLIVLASKRWQYYGPALFALAGVAAARWRNEPYDAALRAEAGLRVGRAPMALTLFFTFALAGLLLFRLVASLAGHGWDRLAAPLHPFFVWPVLEGWLARL